MNLKLIPTLGLLVASLGASAQTIDASPPGGQAWKWTLGAGYQHGTAEYRTNDSPATFKLTQNRVYLRALYGLGKNWDVGLHIGKGNASYPGGTAQLIEQTGFNSISLDTQTNSAGYAGYTGLSFHGTFHAGKRWSFGIAGQGSIFENLKSKTRVVAVAVSVPVTITTTTDINNTFEGFRDGQVALNISALTGRALVYFGPLYYRSSGRERLEITATSEYVTSSGTTTLTASLPPLKIHFRSTQNLGGYIGVRTPAHSDWTFSLEAAYRGGFNVGFGFAYTY